MLKTGGIDIFSVKSSPEHEPSTIVDDPRGKSGVITINRVIAGAIVTETVRYVPGAQFRYGQAANVIVGADVAGGGDALMVDNAQTDALKPNRVTPTAGVTDIVEGIAHVSIPDEFWGFFQIRGRVYNAKHLDAAGVEGGAAGASATAGTLVNLTATTPTTAEVIAAIRYAAGRRAMSLVDVGVNLWDVELRG